MARLAVVTGSSSGIGKAVAGLLLEAGWEVAGIARRPTGFDNARYRHFSADLSDAEKARRFFENEFTSEVDLAGYAHVGLVNNAGMLGRVGPQEKSPIEDMVKAFTLNTIVPVWLMGFFIKHTEQARLNIVNVSSGAANAARAGWSTYCASKAALKMAGMVTAEDIANHAAYAGRREKVTVVSYAPGVVATPMQADVRGSDPEDFPSVERFIGFHESGALKTSDQPAREICALLAREDLPPHSAVTFGD